jgi:hypothetical protein
MRRVAVKASIRGELAAPGREGRITGALADSSFHLKRRLEMMLDWNEYQKQLNGRIAEIAKLSTETVRG